MSEEAAAFARRNEPSDPFPIVPDDSPEAVAGGTTGAGDVGFDAGSAAPEQQLPSSPDRQDGDLGDADGVSTDPVTAAVVAVDSRQFLFALIGILADNAQRGTGGEAAFGVALGRVGQALADGADEASAFQAVVDALDRQRLGEAAMRDVIPITAAFMARVVAGWNLRHREGLETAAVDRLVEAAAKVADGALAAGGSRAWRRLPDIAVTIAGRAAQRGLGLGALADALPRLAPRFGLAPREPAARDGVISITDHPRAELSRGGAADEPRRMVISGPVEIVILDR